MTRQIGQINWSALRLKHEEADYFLSQMNANVRHPKLFLFYLSAFLSSARSLTFHIQKLASNIGKRENYESLREQLLSDELCNFFVNLRNRTEKEGFLELAFECTVSSELRQSRDNEMAVAMRSLRVGSSGTFEYINDALMSDWEKVFQYLGSIEAFNVQPRWYFYNAPNVAPECNSDALAVSREYLERLWHFLVKFRLETEALDASQ